jgi:hypothetical protein
MVLKFGHSESRSEIPREFLNVVMEKDREDQMDRLCEKWKYYVESRRRGE